MSGPKLKYVMAAACLVVAYFTLGPFLHLIYQSFWQPTSGAASNWTLQIYRDIFYGDAAPALLTNTLLFAAGSSLLALLLGGLLAWLNKRTAAPGRKFFLTLALLPLVMPGLLFTVTWVLLLSPRIGLLNQLFPLFNIDSMSGMIWVQGLSNAPLAFLFMSGILRSLDQNLEEMARVSGANAWQTFARVTAPLAAPGFLSLLILLFIKGLAAFEVPAIIGLPAGIPLLSSEIYLALSQTPTDYRLASAYGVLLLILSGVGIVLYQRLLRDPLRFATLRDSFRPRYSGARLIPFLCLTGYFLVSVGLPLLVMVWCSLQPFYSAPAVAAWGRLTLANYRALLELPHITHALELSLCLGLTTACIVLFLATLAAWVIVKTQLPGRALLENLFCVPLAMPGIILGAALLSFYLAVPLPIYGSTWVLLIGYVTGSLPLGLRYTTAALAQIHRELEEAARISGASWWQQFTRITLPLLKPGLYGGGVLIFINCLSQLSMPLLLYSPDSEVLAVAFWDLWNSGDYVVLCALGTVLTVCLLALGLLVGVHGKEV